MGTFCGHLFKVTIWDYLTAFWCEVSTRGPIISLRALGRVLIMVNAGQLGGSGSFRPITKSAHVNFGP